MGIFGDITNGVYNVTYGQKLKRKQYALQEQMLNSSMDKVGRQQSFLSNEQPRQQAGLKQSAFARGIGKSTIYDQDKSRLSQMQDNQNAALANSMETLRRSKAYLRKKKQIEKYKLYADIAADVLDTVLGAFTMGMNQPNYADTGAGMGGGGGAGAGASFGASMGGF